MKRKGPALGAKAIGKDRQELSVSRFSEAFRTAPITMMVSSAEDGRVFAVNDAFVRIIGFSEDELVGHTGDELRLWSDPDLRTRVLAQVLEHGSVEGIEARFISKSGDYFTVILSASRAVFDHHECVIWHAVDITAQRRAESALHSQTQNLNAIVSTIDRYPVSILDRNGVIQSILGGATQRKTYERTPEELRGHRIADIVGPEAARRLLEVAKEVFESGKTREVRFRTSPATGPNRDLCAWYSPIFSPDGEVEAILSVTRDITDQLQDAEALEQLSGTWQSMIEEIPDLMAEGVIVLNSTHEIVWMNRALENFFGLRRIEVGGMDYRQLVREKLVGILFDADVFLARVLAARAHESDATPFSCHVRGSALLEERWLECTSNPLKTGVLAGGRIERFADITRGRIAEGLLRRLSVELRKARSLESGSSSSDSIDPALRDTLVSSSRIVSELQALIGPPYAYDPKSNS